MASQQANAALFDVTEMCTFDPLAPGEQTFTTPSGVSQVFIEASGTQGGANEASTVDGGRGGPATGDRAVLPGVELKIYVRGAGSNSGAGGFNGGGASDVRMGGNSLNHRVIVAGGGGGDGGAGEHSLQFPSGGAVDLPPLNWSARIVRERRIRYGNQTTQA